MSDAGQTIDFDRLLKLRLVVARYGEDSELRRGAEVRVFEPCHRLYEGLPYLLPALMDDSEVGNGVLGSATGEQAAHSLIQEAKV